MGRRGKRAARHGSPRWHMEQFWDAIEGNVNLYMEARRFMLNPFPFKPVEFYKPLISRELAGALKVIQREVPDIVDKTENIYFTLGGEEVQYDMGPWLVRMKLGYLRLDLPGKVPWPSLSAWHGEDKGVSMEKLPPTLRMRTMEWVHEEASLLAQHRLLSNRIQDAKVTCTTVGHVERIWPNLLSVANRWGFATVAEKKARSPYPAGVKLYDGTLSTEWQTHRIAKLDEWLAEAMVMYPGKEEHHALTIARSHHVDMDLRNIQYV